MNVGILALQGDFREHGKVVEKLGNSARLVRRPDELDSADGLIIPGGESTTISKLLKKWGLFDPIREKADEGFPIFGTCAGLILLAKEVMDGPDTLGLLDISVERNAYGRQIESFESELEFATNGDNVDGSGKFTGVFIRAPQIDRVGSDVEVLARHEGLPVLVRKDNLLGATFHPELTENYKIHRFFLNEIIGN